MITFITVSLQGPCKDMSSVHRACPTRRINRAFIRKSSRLMQSGGDFGYKKKDSQFQFANQHFS